MTGKLSSFRPTLTVLALSIAAFGFAACAPGQAPAGTPVADPEAAAAELQRAASIEGPRQITFGWTLDEAGSRLRGRGVARLVAPERIRLDLFGPRGETYVSAALVGNEYRIPGGVEAAVALPSPALLWGAVGVVQPPEDARLLSASSTERELVVRYATGDGETLEYRAVGEPMRLTGVSRAGRTGARETIQLTWDAEGTLQSTRYRNLEAYRELVLSVEEINRAPTFPPTIWNPDGTAR